MACLPRPPALPTSREGSLFGNEQTAKLRVATFVWTIRLAQREAGVNQISSRTRNSARTPVASGPWGRRGFWRAGLVMGLLTFWLNAAMFPCHEAAAAVPTGHAGDGSPAAIVTPSPHGAGATHFEPSDHGPGAPCCDTGIRGAPFIVQPEAVQADRPPHEWFAVEAPVADSLSAVNRAASLALVRSAPPPKLRLYLRTQRLLI